MDALLVTVHGPGRQQLAEGKLTKEAALTLLAKIHRLGNPKVVDIDPGSRFVTLRLSRLLRLPQGMSQVEEAAARRAYVDYTIAVPEENPGESFASLAGFESLEPGKRGMVVVAGPLEPAAVKLAARGLCAKLGVDAGLPFLHIYLPGGGAVLIVVETMFAEPDPEPGPPRAS